MSLRFSEPAELQKCVFADSLVTVSEGGRELGEFSVTVEFARREQPCMMLHAQSHGAIDDCPCGTAVTGDSRQRMLGQTDLCCFLLLVFLFIPFTLFKPT